VGVARLCAAAPRARGASAGVSCSVLQCVAVCSAVMTASTNSSASFLRGCGATQERKEADSSASFLRARLVCLFLAQERGRRVCLFLAQERGRRVCLFLARLCAAAPRRRMQAPTHLHSSANAGRMQCVGAIRPAFAPCGRTGRMQVCVAVWCSL